MNSDLTDEKLQGHIGHDVVVVTYGDPAVNVALECEDCCVVLADCDTEQKGTDMDDMTPADEVRLVQVREAVRAALSAYENMLRDSLVTTSDEREHRMVAMYEVRAARRVLYMEND